MPFVRISLRRQADATPANELGRKVGEIVFRSMWQTLNVPPQDNFQVITTHDEDGLICDPSYLDIPS